MKKNTNQEVEKERIEKFYAFLSDVGIKEKQINIIKGNEVPNTQIINEALTHTSANSPKNHEKLEFLGDAVLRLAASEYIEENYPKLKVGERSALRSQLVSDKWLANIGSKIGIRYLMIIGTKAEKDKAALETIEAEGLEALIGAIYTCLKDIEVIKSLSLIHI